MKIRIETIGTHHSGLGHVTRMQTLALELTKELGTVVEIVDQKDYEEFDCEDLVIVDVDTEEDAVFRIRKVRKNLPNTKIVLFKNDDGWGDVEDVELVILPEFCRPIISPAFRNFYRTHLNPEISSIFVNQGGSDPWGLTPRILGVLGFLKVPFTIFTVLGRGIHEITKEQVVRFMSCRTVNVHGIVYYDLNQKDMATIMEASDLAITAPGQTFVELVAMSVPTIIIGHHDRHAVVGNLIRKNAASMYLGVGPTMKDIELLTSIEASLKIMSSHFFRKTIVKNAHRLVNTQKGIEGIIKDIVGIL